MTKAETWLSIIGGESLAKKYTVALAQLFADIYKNGYITAQRDIRNALDINHENCP